MAFLTAFVTPRQRTTKPLPCLASRLRRQGLSLGVNALQNILRGKQPLARREILEELLALLRQHDICSEADAEALWRR